MIAYLTSTFGGSKKVDGVRFSAPIMTDNCFVDNLKQHWKENSNLLIIGTAGDCHERNDEIKSIYSESFPMSNFSLGKIEACDNRNLSLLDNINGFDVVFLTGGSVPDQNRFFEEINLRSHLKNFRGILLSASAGMMNCAETVYALPEAEGEAIDPSYQRFLPGLGITSIMTIPHFQEVQYEVVDGLRSIEDTAFQDSIGREFLALPDGSYLTIVNGTTTLFGEGYRIKDSSIQKICDNNEALQL